MDLHQQAGLYLHIPFCRRKCRYCSFFSVAPQAGEMVALIAALHQQIDQCARLPEMQALVFASLFFGGGTPSLLPVEALVEVLAHCRRSFNWSGEEPEISIEVNPGTIDGQGLAALRRAGFNRLSIGIQSLDDGELSRLGRIHNRIQALDCLRAARDAGFANLSGDLMYGLPGQTPASWRRTLEELLACAPQHLSLYELTVEEGTALCAALADNPVLLPPEETVLEMMDITQRLVDGGGWPRYEISNYARPGYQCCHNVNYWHNGSYLGLGPGAVSGLNGERRAAVADLHRYCQRVGQGQSVWEEVERLQPEAAFRETVIMGLRMTAGVSIEGLCQRFAIDLPSYYGTVFTRLVDQDLLLREGDRIRLSSRGLALANRVMAELV